MRRAAEKSAKAVEDDETERGLTGAITLFKYLSDKDVFQKFYTDTLAKRLVNSKSASDDAESSMIGKLKVCRLSGRPALFFFVFFFLLNGGPARPCAGTSTRASCSACFPTWR